LEQKKEKKPMILSFDPRKEYEKQMRTQEAILERVSEFEELINRICDTCADIGLLFLEVRNKVDQTSEVTAGILAGIAHDVIGSVCDRMNDGILPSLVDLIDKKYKEKIKNGQVLTNREP